MNNLQDDKYIEQLDSEECDKLMISYDILD